MVETFLWHITASELLPGAISCLISQATRLLGFTDRKLMPDWNHTLQRDKSREGNQDGEIDEKLWAERKGEEGRESN